MALRGDPGAGRGRAARGGRLALVLLFVAAAVVATAPAVGHLGSAFIAAPGGQGGGEPFAGDHLQSVYRFWLVGEQLERGAAPWRDPFSFQPLVEPQLVLAGWPYGIPFWPVDALLGPVVAWNLLLLASIALAGLATTAWLRTLRLPLAAAVAGGLAFALAPYRLIQSGGHLLGWMAVFLPVALWAVERGRSAPSERSANIWGAVAAAALVSVPLSGQVHLALGALPLALAYAAIRFRRTPFLWTLAGVLAGAGIAIAIQRTVIDGSVLAGGGRSLDQLELFQADWTGLIDRFGLTGREQDVYLGWLLAGLGVAGVVLLWRRSRALAVLAAVAVLGPVLLSVGTNLPAYAFLFDHVPPLRYPRVPQRFLPVADLALAGLAALAIAWLLSRAPTRWRLGAGILAVTLVVADLLVLPMRSASADPGNLAYRALAAQPQGRTLELPLFEPGIHFGSIYNYYALQAPRGRPGGYSTLAPPVPYDWFWEHNRLNCGVWYDGDRQHLARLGITTITYHRGAYAQSLRPGAWFAWRALQERGLRATAAGSGVWLFPLDPRPGVAPQAAPVPEPPRSEPVLCEAWKAGQMKQRTAPLWVYGPGPVVLTLASPEPVDALVSVDLGLYESYRIDGETTIRVPVDGEGWHLAIVSLRALFETAPPRGLELVAASAG